MMRLDERLTWAQLVSDDVVVPDKQLQLLTERGLIEAIKYYDPFNWFHAQDAFSRAVERERRHITIS